jgi:tRNA1Val (adenine37-N6)-methyltransferase
MARQQDFQCKQFHIAQNDCAMKVTLDACLFAARVTFHNPEHLLDIGAGTGLLSLFLAQRYPQAKITALEIEATASTQCAINFAHSPFHTRLSSLCADIREFQPAQPYNSIICNPPFFTSGSSSQNEQRAQARHAYGLPLQDLLGQISRLLRNDGEAWLLLGEDALQEVQSLLPKHGLYLNQRITLQARADKPVHRSFVKLTFTPQTCETEHLLTYAEGTAYSVPARALLAPFFIKL